MAALIPNAGEDGATDAVNGPIRCVLHFSSAVNQKPLPSDLNVFYFKTDTS